jgi:hypothetical protein
VHSLELGPIINWFLGALSNNRFAGALTTEFWSSGALPTACYYLRALITPDFVEDEVSSDRRSVGQYIVVSSSHLELMTRLLFLYRQLRVSCVGRPLWQEDGSVIYCTIASGPCQNSHSRVRVPQNSGHILLSHLRLSQPGGPGPRIYIPQEQGRPVTPPGTEFPVCRLLLLLRSYSNPPPHGQLCIQGLSVKPSSATNVQGVFIYTLLSQHVSAYLMAILKRIVQITQRSYYSYNGSVVFSTITCVSCRQLLPLFFLCINFKYFVKILKC